MRRWSKNRPSLPAVDSGRGETDASLPSVAITSPPPSQPPSPLCEGADGDAAGGGVAATAGLAASDSPALRHEKRNEKVSGGNGRAVTSSLGRGGSSNAHSTMLPILGLFICQTVSSSWHVMGKRVMDDVPFLTPVAYVIFRTFLTSTLLTIAARVFEGRLSFPSFRSEGGKGLSSRGREGATLPARGLNFPPIHRHRARRIKHIKRLNPRIAAILGILCPDQIQTSAELFSSVESLLSDRLVPIFRTDAFKIVCAGTSGMMLLPMMYTTGLVLTTPTVASVWDGPMIPLGCFSAAVALGLERPSRSSPGTQVAALLAAVGGSILVLVGDFHHHDHWSGRRYHEFLEGNLVLMGVVAAYTAMALLQRSLIAYPPLTLTSWMFCVGTVACFLVVSIGGRRLVGASLLDCFAQLTRALTESSLFRWGLAYSTLALGFLCYTMVTYASKHLESSVVTLFTAVQPPITVLMEAIAFGKPVGWKKILGMITVVGGMYVFTAIKRRDARLIHNQLQVKTNRTKKLKAEKEVQRRQEKDELGARIERARDLETGGGTFGVTSRANSKRMLLGDV